MKYAVIISLYFLSMYSTHAQQQNDLIIKNINVIAMTNSEVLKNTSVLFSNGKIKAIADFKELPKNKKTTILNGKGKFLMPGLAEMHSHLPMPSKVDTLLMENVAAGITRLRIMNTNTPLVALKNRLESNSSTISPKLYYSHSITRDIDYNATQFDSLMITIKKNNFDFIKVLSVANEVVFDNLMQAANKHQVIVCGHFPAGVQIEKVLTSGYKSIEHLAGYDKIKNTSELGKMIELTKEKEVYNCPTLDWDLMSKNLQYPNEYKNRLVYTNAPKQYINQWEKEYTADLLKQGATTVLLNQQKNQPVFEYKQKILKQLSDNNCLLLMGSDPSTFFQMNGFNLHQEMYNWSQAGIDNFSILKAATITPARFFNEEKLWGTIEVGKAADAIILEKNPLDDIRNITTVEMTIINGKTYLKKNLVKK